MASGLVQPPNVHAFTRDNMSSVSNLSQYTHEAYNRIVSGDFIYEPSVDSKPINKTKHLSHLTDNEITERPLNHNKKSLPNSKRNKAKLEFTVTRKNSYKGPNYFKIHGKTSPLKNISTDGTRSTGANRSKFENFKQIDPVFDIFPESSVLENPSYMVQYFTKTIDLIKKNPEINYHILKAKINTQNSEDSIKKVKQKKYQSLPVIGSSKAIKEELEHLRKNQRKSAPPILSYEPTDMTITEYLNSPLDFYKHRKQISDVSDKSKETKVSFKTQTTIGTNRTNGDKTKSSGSGADSISTATLYARHNRLVEGEQMKKESSKNTRSLKTKRNDSIMKRRSVLSNNDPDVDNLADIQLSRKLSGKQEKYFSKYGTPLLDVNTDRATMELEDPKRKRNSEYGALSIATGDDIYQNVRSEIFGNRMANWASVLEFLEEKHPDLIENTYFLTRIMFEIYLRRILAARIAVKLGTDKSNKGEGNEVWIGLKESIAAVYGEENALFFETQNNEK